MAATTLTDRAVVRLSGEDVRGFLQGLVTSDVMATLPVWAGLLTPQGKCLFDFIIWADGDDLLLDCEAEAADDLDQEADASIGCAGRSGSSATTPWRFTGRRDGGAADPRLPELGRRWLGPAEEAAAGWLEHRLRLGVTRRPR